MTGRSYELPDDITTLGGMVIFVLINTDIWGARPRGFRIPKLSQVHVLTRFYALVPLLPYLNPQVSSVFDFVVLTGQYCNIWNPNPRLTVTDRDERASADSTSRSVTGNGADHEVGWKELAASRGRHSCRVSPRLPLAGVAGLFAALPPRWGCADRRIVLLTACQLVWEAL